MVQWQNTFKVHSSVSPVKGSGIIKSFVGVLGGLQPVKLNSMEPDRPMAGYKAIRQVNVLSLYQNNFWQS